ncbi:MAG: ABC transporter permease [Actinomycetota bacterium]|nr:ABC transporter permease [Actinomycetota bacterium]
MTERAVPVEAPDPRTPVSTEAADALGGAAVAAITEVSEPRRHLGVVFWVSLGWIVLTILAAIFANVLPLQDPNLQSATVNAGPSAAHFFGTDQLGRDIFSRVIFGSRVSIVVGFGAIAIGLLTGGTLGMVAAYYRGAVDVVVNAVSYVLLAFPALVAVIAIVTFWKASLWKITLIIGVASAPLIFRIVRASTLSYATRDFVTAARTLGATNRRILTRELLPNILPTVVSFSLIGVATVIVLEGSLAFLGLSIPGPTPSWGNMLNQSRTGLNTIPGQSNPWLVIFPALAMFLFLISLNLVGDRLRQHFDVSEIKL